jgi:hypothetical protein
MSFWPAVHRIGGETEINPELSAETIINVRLEHGVFKASTEVCSSLLGVDASRFGWTRIRMTSFCDIVWIPFMAMSNNVIFTAGIFCPGRNRMDDWFELEATENRAGAPGELKFNEPGSHVVLVPMVMPTVMRWSVTRVE